MLFHLVQMMSASDVSGPGRDSAINLLIKQVPRKSLKNPDNSLTLWLIDQGMKLPISLHKANFRQFSTILTQHFCYQIYEHLVFLQDLRISWRWLERSPSFLMGHP